MKRRNDMVKRIAYCILAVMLIVSCTNEYDDITATPDDGRRTIEMVFDGSISGFDGLQTRATTTFADGTEMYIKFQNGGNWVEGTAVYNSSSKTWSLSYKGTLTNVSNYTCKVDYIVNPKEPQEFGLDMDENSVLYRAEGRYTKTSSSLTITATLTPQMSRVRFKGESGTVVTVNRCYGLATFYMYWGSLFATNSEVALTVQSTGYTPYMYYVSCDSKISISVDGKTYTREATAVMQSYLGKSGYLTIPTSSNNSGWTESK